MIMSGCGCCSKIIHKARIKKSRVKKQGKSEWLCLCLNLICLKIWRMNYINRWVYFVIKKMKMNIYSINKHWNLRILEIWFSVNRMNKFNNPINSLHFYSLLQPTKIALPFQFIISFASTIIKLKPIHFPHKKKNEAYWENIENETFKS